jgi:hypothetical protein
VSYIFYDRHDNEWKIITHDPYIAKIVSPEYEKLDPDNTSDDIVGDKFGAMPAKSGAKVLMIGMKRAKMIVLVLYFS